MKPLFSAKSITGERRRHERVEVSYAAQVHVTDDKGKRVGVLRQLSRSGFMIEPEREFKEGKKLKLVLVDRKARVGRNPTTGEQINIPAKRVVKFRVAKAAKDAILGAKK